MSGNRINDIPFERHEQMLFALLRSSLSGKEADTVLFSGCTEGEWKRCYSLALEQGIMALAWDGVVKLPKELLPPLPIKLVWAAAVERYEKWYRYYCKTVDELSRFYEEHGIVLVMLKGVGLSSLYPVPSHREGGDIDIYTYSANRERMSDADANRLADSLMRQSGIDVDNSSYKHSVFTYKGIPVENHKVFINVKQYKGAVEIEKLLKERMNPQLTALEGGSVLTPSPAFNTLFVPYHAAQHYGCGLTLHHLCDWACVLKNYGLCLPAEINGTRFRRFIFAFTLLSDRLLGTDIQIEGTQEEKDTGEKMACEILNEMLHPRYGKIVPATSKAGVFIFKIRRMMHHISVGNQALGQSACRTILSSMITHARAPKTIFYRGTE